MKMVALHVLTRELSYNAFGTGTMTCNNDLFLDEIKTALSSSSSIYGSTGQVSS